MKSPGFTRMLALFSLLTVILLGFPSLQAAPGDLDSPKVAIGGGTVLTAVPQPDGKILIGGSFATVQGKPRNRIARLKANGALDTAFNPNADGIVESIVVQADGKIVIGGFFTTLQPGAKGPVITRRHIARLEANGTVDAGFDPNADREVLTMALQSDGKIVIGGRFGTLQPNGAATASTRTRIARLLPDGSLEAGFATAVSGDIYTLALQPDGKVLLGGNFVSVGDSIRRNRARLNANGSLDSGFSSLEVRPTNSIAVQPDGKILVGGSGFGIARLNSNGTHDLAFQPNANGRVESMAVQTDGKILIAGAFTRLHPDGTPSPVDRNRIARLLPDGMVDAGFNPDANGDLGCVALQADGKILIGGSFSALGSAGTARAGFARLLNDPATQGLTVPTTNQLSWARGGSSPEFAQVTFELGTTKGKTWTPLGAGQRVGSSSHWQITGLTLPAAGRIRARGVTGDGNGSHGGLIESVLNYTRLAARPEIAVFSGNGTAAADERADGVGSHRFPATAIAAAEVLKTFTIKNTGMADLTGLALGLTGAATGDFSLGTSGATTLAPGATTTFTVAFSPRMLGDRSATLMLASNDGDEDSFTIHLLGNGLPSRNAELSDLVLDGGNFSPAFSPGTTAYVAQVPRQTPSVRVIPTKVESNAGIAVRVNDEAFSPVPSGGTSNPLSLRTGQNNVEVQVTAQDGSTRTYTIVVTREGAIQGTVDALNAQVAGWVASTVVQPDGKVIISGNFRSVLGVPRENIARINPDGTLDEGFDPNPDGTVLTVVVQPDGKVLLGGEFTRLQSNGAPSAAARHHVARVHPDGSLDPGFDPRADGGVSCMALQRDGKVLLGGSFTALQPNGAIAPIPRDRLARVNPDGSLDAAFDSQADGDLKCLALQADGKMLLGGEFISIRRIGEPSGPERKRIARLNADGSLDAGFDPAADHPVHCIVPQPDGRILVGGAFVWFTPNGSSTITVRGRVARLNADGTVDDAFNPTANGVVNAIALQTDGKILFGGEFSTLRPNGAAATVSRNRVARVHADGSVDEDFDPRANNHVLGMAIQADGKVLLAGSFSDLYPNGASSGTARYGFARLFNEPAGQSLTVPGGSRIEWLRGGASPEVEHVIFEHSSDRGANYLPLGAGGGTRIAGGWELAGISPPAGQIRARGRTPGGWVESVIAHGIATAPEIGVSGDNMAISNGSNVPAVENHTDFGSVPVSGIGSSRIHTFVVANTGTTDLTLGEVTLSGANAGDFTVSRQPAPTLAAGHRTSFAITFDPGATGLRTAALGFSSNDGDESLFQFAILGTGYFSNNADLAALSIGGIILDPAFSPAVTAYTSGVLFGATSTVVSPEKADPNATVAVRVNGGAFADVFPGSTSGPWPLVVGGNLVEIQVTAHDGSTVKTYTVSLNRAAAGPGDLDPLDAKLGGSSIYSMAVQPDGKTIIAGVFSTVQGVSRRNVARLNADGTLDEAFYPNPNQLVTSVAVQDDGKILLGGWFTALQPNGSGDVIPRNRIARLHADGTLDTGFDPNANTHVNGVALQADGKILLLGPFTSLRPQGSASATVRNRFARLHADGTLDASFDPNPNGDVYCMAVQEDGKILLGGNFTALQPNGAASPTTRNRIARLNADGTLDAGFDPDADRYVACIFVQPDGKVLLGGAFENLRPNGTLTPTVRSSIARVHADGALDGSFDPHADNVVDTMALQSDGKILLGGNFTTLRPHGTGSAVSRNFIARVNGDGTLDPDFDPSANSRVYVIGLQADGRVMLGGSFATLHPRRLGPTTSRNRFAMLLNEPATQGLDAPDATRVSWTRGGTSPVISQVTFELSTDGGSSYTPLGNATRVGSTADWQLTGLSLPASGQLRARGRTADGDSSGLVETVATFGGLADPLESWRQTHFGSPANEGNGADHFDFDQDGLVNLIEYAFGLDPLENSAGQLPQPRTLGENFGYEFTPPAGSAGVVLGAEWSPDLIVWQPVPDTGSGGQRVFSVPRAGETKLFLRLTVTSP